MNFWEYYEADSSPFDFIQKYKRLRLVNKNEELAKQICSEAKKYHGVLQGIQEYNLGTDDKIKETEKRMVLKKH